jgi:hypothetical protein
LKAELKAKAHKCFGFFARSTTPIIGGIEMKKGWANLKKKFEEHPVEVIAVCSVAVVAAAKLIDALSAAQGRRAYAKQVNYRVNK